MKIKEKVERFEWSQCTVDVLKAELDQVIIRELDVPLEPGGWWHQYVCPTHHSELMFDPFESDARSYTCPYGCVLEGEPYRGAWLVFKHQAMARYVLQAATVYAGTGEYVYAELGKRLIVRYAEQFPLYPVHPDAQPWMLKGRAFHQALTEAIWSTTILRGYLLLLDEGVRFNVDERKRIIEFLHLLESSMTEYHRILTQDRGNPENNYTAWLIAALFCIYAVRGETGKLKAMVNEEGGLRNHLTIAVRADQLEFEGSVYYHVFVLRAYLIAAEMGERLGEDLYFLKGDHGQSMEGMLSVLVRLADRNGFLPALHDGPYRRVPFAREIAEIVETGLSVYGDESYQPLIANAYREMNGQTGRSGMLEALLYGNGDWNGTLGEANRAAASSPTSIVLPDSGLAVIRTTRTDGLQALVDFGPHGGSHGHYDKLNLMIHVGNEALSPDRGTVPYGSVLKKEWYPHTACHNTVAVGERSQLPSEGKCMRYESAPDSAYIWLRSDQAYEKAILNRHLLLTDEWLLDWFEVELEEPDIIDWWFHYIGNGKLNGLKDDMQELWAEEVQDRHSQVAQDEAQDSDAIRRPNQPFRLGSEDGYAYVTEGQVHTWPRVSARGQLDLHISHGSVPLAVTSIVPFIGMACVQVETPGIADDPSGKMEGMLLRRIDTRARFIAVYRVGDEPIELSWNETKDGEWLTLFDGKSERNLNMTSNGLKERVLHENLI